MSNRTSGNGSQRSVGSGARSTPRRVVSTDGSGNGRHPASARLDVARMTPRITAYSTFPPVVSVPDLDEGQILAEARAERPDGRDRVLRHHCNIFMQSNGSHLLALRQLEATLLDKLALLERIIHWASETLEHTDRYLIANLHKKEWTTRAILELSVLWLVLLVCVVLEVLQIGSVLSTSGVDAFAGWRGFLWAGYGPVPAIVVKLLLGSAGTREQRKRWTLRTTAVALGCGFAFLAAFAFTNSEQVSDPANRLISAMTQDTYSDHWAFWITFLRQVSAMTALSLTSGLIVCRILAIFGGHFTHKLVLNPAYTMPEAQLSDAMAKREEESDSLALQRYFPIKSG